MKRLILAVMVAGLGFGAAFAANGLLYVEYNGEREILRRLDLDALSVCGLKRQIASKYDLEIREFDLKKTGES